MLGLQRGKGGASGVLGSGAPGARWGGAPAGLPLRQQRTRPAAARGQHRQGAQKRGGGRAGGGVGEGQLLVQLLPVRHGNAGRCCIGCSRRPRALG